MVQEKNNLLIESYIRLDELEDAQNQIDSIDNDNESGELIL